MMQYLKRTTSLIFIFIILFLTIITLRPGSGYSDFLFLFSASAAVIFGIYIVFTISNSRDRLNKTNELLKIENANNLHIYRLSKVFGFETQNQIRELIDNYLVMQIDYRIEDFSYSASAFEKINEFIINLSSANKRQENAHCEMMGLLTSSSTNRSQVETIVTQRLSKFEWTSILGLTFVIITLLYDMTYKGEGVLKTVMVTVLAAACFLLVLVLRDINNLEWQKDTWTWKPLRRLFISMDLLPYYSKPAIDKGEIILKANDIFRLASYPNKYPDVITKNVETVKYSGKEYITINID